MGTKRSHKLRTVLIAIVCSLVLLVGVGWGVVQWRLAQARSGEGAVAEPDVPTALEGTAGAGGQYSAHAEYTSIAADEGTIVSTDFSWDDDWFFADPTEYNHELAHASSVFSAVAISESEYYQQGSDAAPYMENLLAQLGFENVSTSSYQYRSEVIDEVANIFGGNGTDVTAYCIASKHITDSQTGQQKTLVVVSVRGSYGSEWLSNLRMDLSDGLLEGYDIGAGDHTGFSAAGEEVASATLDYLDALSEQAGEELDLRNVAVLFTGHSRGAATANLAAAYLDDLAEEGTTSVGADDEASAWYVHANSIYCYAFATPRLSSNDKCRTSAYDNIFNILNPSDLVPRLPLAAWGYERYGRDLWLPEPGCNNFDEQYERFKTDFERDMGCEAKYDPVDAANVDDIEATLGADSATLEEFQTPVGIARAVLTLATKHDIVRILQGHAPNTYIAWISAIDASDLRSER